MNFTKTELNIRELYNYILNLRNRLSNDGDGNIFEEDHLMLDHVLDFLEKEITNENTI